jgi:hypothetical protein
MHFLSRLRQKVAKLQKSLSLDIGLAPFGPEIIYFLNTIKMPHIF